MTLKFADFLVSKITWIPEERKFSHLCALTVEKLMNCICEVQPNGSGCSVFIRFFLNLEAMKTE